MCSEARREDETLDSVVCVVFTVSGHGTKARREGVKPDRANGMCGEDKMKTQKQTIVTSL